jgi:HEAT repeat protein
LIALSGSNETEFRLTVAWLMGFDNSSPQFHEALLKLLKDAEPIVRRNAALALVRFNDTSGRAELVAILQPYAVKANASGVIASSLQEGATVARATLLARITLPEGQIIEVRSPLPARIQKLFKANGAEVIEGEEVLSLNSDENSVWEALRGLALIGGPEDVHVIEAYANSKEASARVRDQAQSALKAIKGRNTDSHR